MILCNYLYMSTGCIYRHRVMLVYNLNSFQNFASGVGLLRILSLALTLQGCTTAFNLCFKSMVADLLDGAQRAKGFVVLNHADATCMGSV